MARTDEEWNALIASLARLTEENDRLTKAVAAAVAAARTEAASCARRRERSQFDFGAARGAVWVLRSVEQELGFT